MTTVAQITGAVRKLPKRDLVRFRKWFVQYDAAAWDRLTADDFTLVDDTGAFMTKAQRLAQFKTQKPTAYVAPQRVQVKKYGDVYVRRFLNGGNLWVMDIWVRQPTGWRVAAVQTTTAKK